MPEHPPLITYIAEQKVGRTGFGLFTNVRMSLQVEKNISKTYCAVSTCIGVVITFFVVLVVIVFIANILFLVQVLLWGTIRVMLCDDKGKLVCDVRAHIE